MGPNTHPRITWDFQRDILRINGDESLKGYCYGNRKVFCVMYYQSSVPC